MVKKAIIAVKISNKNNIKLNTKGKGFRVATLSKLFQELSSRAWKRKTILTLTIRASEAQKDPDIEILQYNDVIATLIMNIKCPLLVIKKSKT